MKTGQTAAQIDSALRTVFEVRVGEGVGLTVHDHGARKVMQVEGQIIAVTVNGVLIQNVHRAGRSLIAYRDIFIRHAEVQSPDDLADAVREALRDLGVRVEVDGQREHRPVADDGRFGARLGVGPNASGVHRAKKLVG